jgi:phenylalanyl-tRNA synthetase alpha chain
MNDSNLDTFRKQIESLKKELLGELIKANSLKDLEEFKVHALGKKGRLTGLMKELGKMSANEKPQAGQLANQLRQEISLKLDSQNKEIGEKEISERLRKERIDISLEGRLPKGGSIHPVHLVQEQIVNILAKCGFAVEVGPELEHEFFNFDALNFPKNHPARAMQDTFYIEGNESLVLRAHTSPVQIRTMMMKSTPIRMICPGRVYRADYDPTHSPMFHQVEGLLVDKDVVMGDLKGILEILVKEFFASNLKVRLRPSFFPFTEPSAEVDMECCFCHGEGCRTCKDSGWIEIGGCGMVDPEVFKAVGIDPEKMRGFAFGMGIERMAMLKYGVNDLRAFYESHSHFLNQFNRWNL